MDPIVGTTEGQGMSGPPTTRQRTIGRVTATAALVTAASVVTPLAVGHGGEATSGSVCTRVPGLSNGMQVHGGGVPLHKNGVLVGAIGVSGDGIEEDEFVAANGIVGFEAPVDHDLQQHQGERRALTVPIAVSAIGTGHATSVRS